MNSRLEMMIGNIKQRITEYKVPSKAEFLLAKGEHMDNKNDNNIELGSVERNKIVNSYSEGKIYVLIKNI